MFTVDNYNRIIVFIVVSKEYQSLSQLWQESLYRY